MPGWITENIGTIVIALALAALVVCVVRSLVRDRRQGKSSCGGNCGHCPMGGACRGGGNHHGENRTHD